MCVPVVDVLNEKVALVIKGEKVEMTKKEAVIQQMINESMKGKSAATKNLLRSNRLILTRADPSLRSG